MAKEITIKAAVFNQMGIIIVRDMSSTDLRQQNHWMRKVTATVVMITVITAMAVTASRPDENKEKQRP